MFKRLGIFAILAVCLFAIVIVMVGCERDEGEKKTEIVKPPVEETPMEKLPGIYELGELGSREPNGDLTLQPKLLFLGIMFLYPSSDGSSGYDSYESNGSIRAFGESTRWENETWSADEATIRLTIAGNRTPYTWNGKYLTMTNDEGYMRWERTTDWSDGVHWPDD